MSATAELSARVTAFVILSSHAPRGSDGLSVHDSQQAVLHSRFLADMMEWTEEPVNDAVPSTVQRLLLLSPRRQRGNDVALKACCGAHQNRVARQLSFNSVEEDEDDDDDEEVVE